ncbi:efflux RND transporter periplasmic adaptor subunit [Robertkochia sediminum]|uniref:efflux RND transporter periplasmic adaptor subunit n=1 Tax=Robertkochia sediminum TaxID=2785326 RepID=UPI0019324E18|nr:efflux RND transporter periplasmic adaptor subunit [Robertkochia sediminum]MBL7474083.1 efflux RND transporter periplasmic adaptor subunit [Robertkochia sediminum]
MRNFILYMAIVLVGCKSPSEEGAQAIQTAQDTPQTTINKEQFRSNGMELATINAITATERIRTTGTIDVPPENRVEVSPLMGGYVTHTPLLVGDRVKKGQLLMSLENPEFVTLQQQYLEVKQQLEYLEEEYERNQKLLEEQITSRKNFLKAQSEYLTAKARFHGLQKQLQLLNLDPEAITGENIVPVFHIYAPISGSITGIDVNRGSFVPRSHPAMVIINSDHLHLELNIFEKDILKVKKGQPIHFRIPEASREVFPAEVHLISDALSSDRTVRVHGHIDDALKEQLKVGMYVEAEITTDATDPGTLMRYTVPTSAVIEKGQKHFIMILEKEDEAHYVFRMLEVTPGNEIAEQTVILKPRLDTTVRVLARGAFDLIR